MNRSVRYRLALHGQQLVLHQHADDLTLPRLAREFGKHARYNLERLRLRLARPRSSAGQTSHIMVDIGCNLADVSIAAWLTNRALQILCLEPMPITFLYAQWNLVANGVRALTPSSFGRAAEDANGASLGFRGWPVMGGVLALNMAATADGRNVTLQYSPTLSGFGRSSASMEDGGRGRLPRSAGLKWQRNGRGQLARWVTLSGMPSLHLSAFLNARGVYSLAFLKCDCEGCEHEVLPALASLLHRTKYFEGELHLCAEEHGCHYGVTARLATARALCAAGHDCQQCFCAGHGPESAGEPCSYGVCVRESSSSPCKLWPGGNGTRDVTPTYRCELPSLPNDGHETHAQRLARACPYELRAPSLRCWSWGPRVFYNLLPRAWALQL